MIATIELTGQESDTELKAHAFAMFCIAHPVEAYAHDPEAFWEFFQKMVPDGTREEMLRNLKECEEHP